MTDEELSRFILQGNIIALRHHLNLKSSKPDKIKEKKQSLMEKLHDRLKQEEVRESEDDITPKSQKKKHNATKSAYKVELGWLDFDDTTQQFKQVRAKKGGGTLTLSKSFRKEGILKEAKSCF